MKKTALQIGLSRQAAEELGNIVLGILNTSCGDTVKVQALQAVERAFAINNVTVNNCSFTS
jgi:hypothetical protein